MQNFQLSHDFLSSQRSAGASDDQIASIIAKRDPKFASELDNVRVRASQYSNADKFISGFLNYKVYGDATYNGDQEPPAQGMIQKRGENLRQDFANIAPKGMGPQHIPEAAWNVAGEGFGLANDVLGAGIEKATPFLNAITPEPMKQVQGMVAQGIGAAIDSPLGQKVQEGYGSFKEAHPRLGSNLDAAGNIASFLPVEKIASVGAKSLTESIGPTARALQESGEAALKAKKKSFVQKLVMPELNKKGQTDVMDSFQKVQEGKIKPREVLPTKRDIEIAEAVEKIPEISPNNTHLQNRDAINTGISRVAKDLDEAFLKSDPAFSEVELKARLRDAKESSQSKIIFASDAQAEKLYDALTDALLSRVKGKKKTSALWQGRKEFDVDAQAQGVDYDKMNLKTELAELVRETANNYIEEQMQRTGHTFLPEMREMNNLYIARRNIAPKAAAEAATAMGRWVQKVQQKTRLPKSALLALSSLGIGGGLATGVIQAAAVPALFTLGAYKFGRLVLSPKTRLGLSRALKAIEETLQTTPPAQQMELRQLIKEGNELIRGEIPPVPTE